VKVGHRALLTAAAYGLLLALLVRACLALFDYAEDDAYIHIRIAENLLRTGFPYFNPGEAVMGSSSSGWTVMLALTLGASGHRLEAICFLEAGVLTGATFVFARVCERLSGMRSLLLELGVWLVMLSGCLLSAAGLMETPAALLLLGSGLWLLMEGRNEAFFFLALATAFRLELFVFLVAAGSLHVWQKRSVARVAAWTLAGLLPFWAYDLRFFSTIVPQTIRAKATVYNVSVLANLRTLLPKLDPGTWPIAVVLVLLLVLALVQWRPRAPPSRTTPLLVLPALAILASYLLGHAVLFSWYEPLFRVPIALAILVAVARTRSPVAAGLLALAWLPFSPPLLGNLRAAFDPSHITAYQHFAEGARVRKYLEVGRKLKARYPDAALMTTEIGGLGYGFGGRILDGVGLVTPAALKFHPMRVPEERSGPHLGALPVGFVAEARPELVVSLDVFVEAFAHSPLQDEYVLVQAAPFLEADQRAGMEAVFGSQHLNIFIRKDRFVPGTPF
jgi:hypothetical protein